MKTEDHAGTARRNVTEQARSTRGGGAAAGRGSELAGDPPADRLVRLSVNLGPEVADQLKEYASRKGVSVTEAVRRAIAVLAFVDEARNRGASLNVEEGGVLKEILFLV